MDPVSQAHAEDCFGWKRTICLLNIKLNCIEMQFVESEK